MKVLLIYEGVPERVKTYIMEVDEDDLYILYTAHAKYVNEDSNMEVKNALEKIKFFLNKKDHPSKQWADAIGEIESNCGKWLGSETYSTIPLNIKGLDIDLVFNITGYRVD